MDLNPTEYDVDELRAVAGAGLAGTVRAPDEDGFVWATTTDDDGTGDPRADAADPTPEQCERLLRIGGVDPAALGDQPYLDHVPDGETARSVAGEWLEFLVATGGRDGAAAALARYRAFGWIAAPVEAALRRHVDAAPEALDGDGVLDPADHLLSFGYLIQLLAASGRD